MKLLLYKGKKLVLKLTVEEINAGKIISTMWLPDMELEVDRQVSVFETYSCAYEDMYRAALMYTIDETDLNMIESE